MLNIQPTDRVLEIGSGNRPRKRSNVLCDKYITDNTQRSGGDAAVIDDRPFVVADGLALPFKDKSFDYVVTSHILEHVDDPHRFVRELTRVGKAGYIETPSELGEKIFGWSFHRWVARLDGDTLVLRRRTEDSPFGQYFHQMYASDPLFAEFVDQHFQDFYVCLEWDGDIKLTVEQDESREVRFSRNAKRISTISPLKTSAITMMLALARGILRVIRPFRRPE